MADAKMSAKDSQRAPVSPWDFSPPLPIKDMTKWLYSWATISKET